MSEYPQVELGLIGGSGLYAMTGLEQGEAVRVSTPFGEPSAAFQLGLLGGRRVAFLARHGEGHRLLPGEINYRANIFAFKLLGARRLLSASAVGSMHERIHPREVVVPDQFIDRTRGRPSTFYGDGVAVHIGFGDPICPEVRRALVAGTAEAGGVVHDGGTYLCMEGPAFSTRAESMLYRSWGVQVIGMTNLQEAKLAREAEICYATLALVTDYDCWHEDEEEVSVGHVLEVLRANAELAGSALAGAARSLQPVADACNCQHALQHAIITAREAIPAATRRRLAPLLARYLDR